MCRAKMILPTAPTVLALTVLLLAPAVASHSSTTPCFVSASPAQRRPCTARTGKTFLQYNIIGGIDEQEEEEKRPQKATSNDLPSPTSQRYDRLVIPIVGPIPNTGPLLIGGEMNLDPPTPMQWRALQEAVVVHRNTLRMEKEQGIVPDGGDGGTIDAAPLIAVIDDVSGSGAAGANRYATLAAIVGITSKNALDPNRKRSDDEESFYESMTAPGLGNDVINPFSSTVRLVGIGRATLKDYFYRSPTDIDGAIGESIAADDYWSQQHEEDDEEEFAPPVVMAQFSPLVDRRIDSSADLRRLGDKGARSLHSSPVHALHELNRLSHKVFWMHDERRQMVNGIRAATARLDLRKDDGEYVFDDYDGLGLAGSTQSASFNAQPAAVETYDITEEGSMSIHDFLSRFHGGSHLDPLTELMRAEDQRAAMAQLEQLENFGLSYYGCFSTIPDLTQQALKLFVPYFSEDHRQREEHGLEVASFVALRAIEGYATEADILWALQCTSTTERFQRVYDLMQDHRMQLEKMAEQISEELKNCGEECIDFW